MTGISGQVVRLLLAVRQGSLHSCGLIGVLRRISIARTAVGQPPVWLRAVFHPVLLQARLLSRGYPQDAVFARQTHCRVHYGDAAAYRSVAPSYPLARSA